MNAAIERVETVITPVVEGMGFELIRLQMTGGEIPILQIMAERPDGTMVIEDCASLSRELSVVLDVEDPIAGEYQLEVSSPGIDRPLTRPKDFERSAGFDAKIETQQPIDGQRRFRGCIEGIDDGIVTLTTDKGAAAIPFDDILKAKLILTDALLKAHGA